MKVKRRVGKGELGQRKLGQKKLGQKKLGRILLKSLQKSSLRTDSRSPNRVRRKSAAKKSSKPTSAPALGAAARFRAFFTQGWAQVERPKNRLFARISEENSVNKGDADKGNTEATSAPKFELTPEAIVQTGVAPALTPPTQAAPPAQAPATVPAVIPAPTPTYAHTEPQPHARLPQNFMLDSTLPTAVELLDPHGKFRDSVEAFLLDQRSEHTRRAYAKDLKRFFKYLYGRKHQPDSAPRSAPPSVSGPGTGQVNRTVLIAYKEYLISEGLEHTTIDRHLATLKSFFKWLVEDGILLKSPADGVRFLNPKRISSTRGFSDEEVKKVLAEPDLHTRTGSLHYAILMILFYCGLRRSELCALRTSNLSMERNQRVLRIMGKGNAERIVVLIPPVWNAVKHYFLIARREMTQDQFLFVPLRNNRTGDLNKALDTSMIFYIVTRYAKLAGVNGKVSPHSCRATAISNARDHQIPDRAIQEFAGWASPDMITRYDKRRTAVEDSAAHGIFYGGEHRAVPVTQEPEPPEPEDATGAPNKDVAEGVARGVSRSDIV